MKFTTHMEITYTPSTFIGHTLYQHEHKAILTIFIDGKEYRKKTVFSGESVDEVKAHLAAMINPRAVIQKEIDEIIKEMDEQDRYKQNVEIINSFEYDTISLEPVKPATATKSVTKPRGPKPVVKSEATSL